MSSGLASSPCHPAFRSPKAQWMQRCSSITRWEAPRRSIYHWKSTTEFLVALQRVFHHHFLIVRIYHHPKGTIIFMVTCWGNCLEPEKAKVATADFSWFKCHSEVFFRGWRSLHMWLLPVAVGNK